MKKIQILAISLFVALLGVANGFAVAKPAPVDQSQGLDVPANGERYDFRDDPACQNGNTDACLQNNPIVKWINFGINLLAAIVVLGATIMIVVGGIQYTAAGDNSQSITSAKQKIFNAILGLVAYALLYSFVQWLVPGGVF